MKTVNDIQVVVTPIITDAIVFARISERMTQLLNVFSPTNIESEFDLERSYHGISNAMRVLKIKDERLDNILGSIFNDLVFGNKMTASKKSKLDANELSDVIYQKWVKAIKKYNSCYKIAV